MTDIPNLLKDLIQLDKWDNGVITMQCANQDGSYKHFEFATLDEMIQFMRDMVDIVKENIEVLCRPIQEPIVEYMPERIDLVLATQVTQCTTGMMLDFIDKHYPEIAWNKQLLADIDSALSKEAH